MGVFQNLELEVMLSNILEVLRIPSPISPEQYFENAELKAETIKKQKSIKIMLTIAEKVTLIHELVQKNREVLQIYDQYYSQSQIQSFFVNNIRHFLKQLENRDRLLQQQQQEEEGAENKHKKNSIFWGVVRTNLSNLCAKHREKSRKSQEQIKLEVQQFKKELENQRNANNVQRELVQHSLNSTEELVTQFCVQKVIRKQNFSWENNDRPNLQESSLFANVIEQAQKDQEQPILYASPYGRNQQKAKKKNINGLKLSKQTRNHSNQFSDMSSSDDDADDDSDEEFDRKNQKEKYLIKNGKPFSVQEAEDYQLFESLMPKATKGFLGENQHYYYFRPVKTFQQLHKIYRNAVQQFTKYQFYQGETIQENIFQKELDIDKKMEYFLQRALVICKQLWDRSQNHNQYYHNYGDLQRQEYEQPKNDSYRNLLVSGRDCNNNNNATNSKMNSLKDISKNLQQKSHVSLYQDIEREYINFRDPEYQQFKLKQIEMRLVNKYPLEFESWDKEQISD